MRMKSYRLQQVDKLNDIHMLAWANNMAGATKKNGKPVFRKYKQFFDYQKAVDEVLGVKQKDKFSEVADFISSYKNGKGGN